MSEIRRNIVRMTEKDLRDLLIPSEEYKVLSVEGRSSQFSGRYDPQIYIDVLVEGPGLGICLQNQDYEIISPSELWEKIRKLSERRYGIFPQGG